MAPIEEAPDTTTSKEGSSKRLECQVIGLPRPSVRWYKDGVNITTQTRYKFEYTADGFAVLILENVTNTDQGVYVCVAQNSEGSAETTAQLFIKGKMSAKDEASSSVHQMTSFKKTESRGKMTSFQKTESSEKMTSFQKSESSEKMTSFQKIETSEKMTSQSQRRPLMIGKSLSKDDDDVSEEVNVIVSPEVEIQHNKKLKELYSKYELFENDVEKEKGAIENEEEKAIIAESTASSLNKRIQSNGVETDKTEELSKKDERSNGVEELLEITKFENSSRRLTTDSGITSRSSSFSSEPDINITEESIKEIKEYLHGKADALYKKYEHDMVKEIETSETKVVATKREQSTGITEQVQTSKKQLTSSVSLGKEKLDYDRVNELDARVLAGKYLFDCGPTSDVKASRHHVPELEIVHWKEALENITKDGTTTCAIKSDTKEETIVKIDSSETNVEFQTSEITNDLQMADGCKIKMLNEINIAKSQTKDHQDDSEYITSKSTDNADHIEGDSSIGKQASLKSLNTLQTKESYTENEESRTSNSQSETRSDADKNSGKKSDLSKEEKEDKNGKQSDKQLGTPKGTDESDTNTNKDKEKDITDKHKGDLNTVTDKPDTDVTNLRNQEKINNQDQSNIEQGQDNDDLKGTIRDKFGRTENECGRSEEVFEDLTESKQMSQESESSKTTDKSNRDDKKTQDPELLERKKAEMIGDSSGDKSESRKNKIQTQDMPVINTSDTVDDIGQLQDKQTVSNENVKSSTDKGSNSKTIIKKGRTETYSDEMEDIVCVTSRSIDEEVFLQEACVESVQSSQESVQSTDKYKKEMKLCSANENENGGPRYVQPLDERLEIIDDTQPVVPNVINVMNNWKQNKVRIEDTSLTNELRRRGLTTNFISDDNFAVTNISDIVDAGGIFVTAPAEVKMATSLMAPDNEPIIAEEACKTKSSKESLEIVEKETGEKIVSNKADDNLTSKAKEETTEQEIDEEQILSQSAKTDENIPDLNKLDQVKPEVSILLESSDINVVEGQSFTLKWKINGASWSVADIYKDGTKVKSGSNLKININDDICAVSVEKASLNDTAAYSVGLPNIEPTLGKVTVTVTENKSKQKGKLISVLVENDNININEGETLELRWKIEGASWSSASIFKDGKKVTADNKLVIKFTDEVCTLRVDKSSVGDGGSYSVRIQEIERELGIVKVTVSTDSRKSKQSKPKVEVLIDNDQVGVKEGESFQLKWKITGTSWSSTSIYKDGKKVTANDNVRIKVTGDVCTLDVGKSLVDDGGVYSVKIQEIEETLGNVKVTVSTDSRKLKEQIEQKIEVLIDNDQVGVGEGESFQLKWKITGTSWSSTSIYKDDKKVTADDNVKIKVTGDVCTLDVGKSLVDDGGVYSVKVQEIEETLGNVMVTVSTDSRKFEEQKESKVEVLIDNDQVDVKQGESFQLKWKISGTSWSSTSIYKDGKKVTANDNVKIKVTGDVCTLDVGKSLVDDGGVYSVGIPEIDQMLGAVKVTVSTDSKKPKEKKEPKIEVLMDSDLVNVIEGESFELKWKITGEEWSSTTITKNGKTISAKDKVSIDVTGDVCTLKVDKATVSDGAAYGVSVTNTESILGNVTVSVTSKQSKKDVKSKPEVDTLVDNFVVTEGETVELKWRISGTKLTAENIYKGDKPLEADSNIRIDITDDVCTLCIDKATLSDAAVYSMNFDQSRKGEITVKVTTDEQSTKTPGKGEEDKLEPAVYVLMDNRNIDVEEGDPFSMKWKIAGADWSTASIYKDDEKVSLTDGEVLVQITDDVCKLSVVAAVESDTAIYSIKFNNSEQKQGEIFVDVITEERSKPTEENLQPTVYALTDSRNMQAVEGETFQVTWKIAGTDWTHAGIYKDGERLQPSDNIHINISDDVCTLIVGQASLADDADYTIRLDKTGQDQGEVIVNVSTSTEEKRSSDKTTISSTEEVTSTVSVDADTKTDEETSLALKVDADVENSKSSTDKGKTTMEVDVDTSKSTSDEGKSLSVTVETDVDASKDEGKTSAPTIEAVVDTSESSSSEGKSKAATVDTDVDSSKVKAPSIETDVDTSKSLTDEGKSLAVSVDTDVDSSKDKGKSSALTIEADVDTSSSQGEMLALTAESDVDTSKPSTDDGKTLAPTVDITVDDSSYTVDEGETITLKWKLSGSQWCNASICKDGKKFEPSDGQNISVTDDICTLVINNACVKDGAIYSVIFGDSSMDQGEINVSVTTATEKTSNGSSQNEQIPYEDVLEKDEVNNTETPVKKDEVKKDEVTTDKVKTDEVENDEVKKDETTRDEVKKDEVKKDEMKEDEMKKEEVKKDEAKKDEIKKDEVQEDMLKKDVVKKYEVQEDEVEESVVKVDKVKKDEAKKDKVKKDEAKKDEAKKDDVKKDEMQEDVVKVDEVKKDEAKKDKVKKEEAKKDEVQKDEAKEDVVNKDAAKRDEAKKDDLKQDEAKKDDVKKDEMQEDVVKVDEVKKDEAKKDEVQEDEVKKDKAKTDDAKKDEVKEDVVKKDAAKRDEAKKDDLKQDEAKKDDVKKDEMQEDVVKVDEVKKDEAKKDEVQEDEVKKDKAKTDDAKKDEVKEDVVKKDEANKDEVQEDVVKKDKAKKDEAKKDEVQEDEVQKDKVKKDEAKKDKVKKDEVKEDEVKNVDLIKDAAKKDEAKKDEVKVDEVKKDEVMKDDVKQDEKKEDKVKKDELKKDEMKKDEVKEKEVKKDEVKVDEVKVDEVKKDEVKKDAAKRDEAKKYNLKQDEAMKDDVKKDEMQEDVVKVDDVKKDEAKKDEVQEDEVKKDKSKKDDAKKDEVKEDVVKKDEAKNDDAKKDEAKKDEAKKDEVQEDEVKKDKVKKDEAKKDKMKKDEVKEDEVKKVDLIKDEAKKDEAKKDEVKVDEVKKDEVKKDDVKQDEKKKDKVKKDELKKDEMKKDEVKEKEVKVDEVKKDEVKKDDVKQDEKKKDKVKKDELKKDEMKKDEVKEKEVKVDEVKKDEVKKDDVKQDEKKKDKVKKDELKKDEKKKDEVKEKEVKEDEVKVDEVKVDEVKKDEVKKDDVKQDEKKKDKVKKDEMKEDEMKKDEVKEKEVKKDNVKIDEQKKDEVKKDELKIDETTKSEEVNKDQAKMEEVKEDKLKKDEVKKVEKKNYEVKKDELTKDKVKKDETTVKKDEVKKDETSVKKDEAREDETKKDEAKKDEVKKDEVKKDAAKKDEVKKDEVKKDETPVKKDEAKKDETPVKKDEVKKDEAKEDEMKKDKTPEETQKLQVEVLTDDKTITTTEGESFQVQWKFDGSCKVSANVCKDGQSVQAGDNVHVDVTEDICTLSVDKASLSNSGNYSLRLGDTGPSQGEINVDITSCTGTQFTVIEEPKFLVEPVIDVEDGRILSIRCSVSGFPVPSVTWYHEGEALTPDALWDIYNQDDYHYLEVNNSMTLLNCQEIVCRVENDTGFVQRVVRVKKDGDEVYCEPVLPPVNIEPLGDINSPPYIQIEISEINTDNLRKVTLLEKYTDSINMVTMEADGEIEVLACVCDDSILARNHPAHDKVCYIPIQTLAFRSDVSTLVCKKSGETIASVTQENKDTNNTEDTTMPERRKMKSPSPKMTSTPKTKRKETEETDTNELQKRLGFPDSPNSRKEFSSPGDSVELSTEYNDGTTRPMFKKRLKSVIAKTGEMAQLECQVSGNPLPKILWLKNNRPLKASDGCKVIVDEGTNILVFPQARDEDAGIYTARAMNVNGSIMCSAEFSLSDGEGQAAVPSADSPLDLDFTTPAYFFQMSSCEVSEGRLARFDCRVVAYPRPEIVWMRDGKVIDVDVRFKLLNFNNEIYSLLIQDVRIEDTGRYTCWARNKFGEAMTEAHLNVKVLSDDEDDGDLAPKFLTRFYDQQTTEGTMTGFKCLIAGRPEPSVTWLLDDIEMHDSPGIRVRHKDGMVSLEIKAPKVEQSGSYTCQLSNTAGEATCSAKLTVVEDKLHGRMLPKFLKKFDHITGKEGEEVRFSAVIVGEPRPDVMWLYDHKPISDTNRRFVAKQDGDAYTLIIKNARFEDAGKITCKAVNSEGEVYCSANLNVRDGKFMRDSQDKMGMRDEIDAKFGYIPTFTKRLHDIEVTEGSRAMFECKVMGIPDPEISWMKDGRVITPGTRFRMSYENGTGQLIIENVTSTDTGVYTCIISNSQGKSSSTAALKLEDTTKKDLYKPEKKDERLSRKDRYSPDKYSFDDSTLAKRPYLDMDKKYDVSPKKGYDRSLVSLDDSYKARNRYDSHDSPKRSYGNQSVPLDSYKSYDSVFDGTKLSYESPISQYESYKPKYESPTSQYESYKPKYESPSTQYESYKPKYESPTSQYESYKPKYETPSSQYESYVPKYESKPYEPYVPKYDSGSTRYESPIRQYESQRPLYESPKRPEKVEAVKAVPKIPFDRPALLSKEEDSVCLSWLPAPVYNLPEEARHVSYVVESRELPGQAWKKVASSVMGTTYTARNLNPDNEYEFRVRAQNQHGMSEPTWSAVLDKRVDDKSRQVDIPEVRAPPRLPTHRPIITDLGPETLRLAWKPVEPIPAKRIPPVSYRLEAQELPGKDWMPLSDRLRDTSHYLSQLGTDRDYMIRVRAENDYGVSEPTEPLWLPRARTFPGVPITRPKIVDYEETRAKLSWSRVDIPTYSLDDSPLLYMLEVEEPPHKDWRTLARDLDDTEYIVDGLRPGNDYRFRIRAKAPSGVMSEPSPAVSLFTTLAQGRSPVDRLQMLDYEPDTHSLQLSWDRVNIPPYNMDDDSLMYMIEYQEPPMPDWKPIVTGIPTTRYRVMHLDPKRDYNFRVRALTSYGVSPPSPSLPVTLRQSTAARGLPEAVVISEVESDSLRLTWRRPMYDLDRSISYKIEMLEPLFSDWRPIASNVMDTTYKVTGLKPTKDYQFRVIPNVGTSYLEPSSSAALTMLPVRPRLPMGEPKLKELTPESIQLSWRPAEIPAYQRKHQPIYYKVEMQELPTKAWVPVARKLTSPSYNMTGLRPDQEYKFRVFAETDGGLSEPSLPAVLHRKPVPLFSSNMPTIKDISQNVVHLSWLPADIGDGVAPVSYMVEMQTPPGIGSWRTLYSKHPAPSVRLADLRPDLDYMVRVRVQSGSYLSEPTLPVYIPRRAAPPRLPQEEPYAVDISSDYVKLQWRSADIPSHIMDYAPISYRLEAQELPDTTWITIQQGIPHTDFKVTGLNPQRDYSFRVRAENEYGLSDPTQPMVLRKRSVAPSLPIDEPLLYDVGPGSCRLSWRPATLPSYSPVLSTITYTLFVQEFPHKTWRPLVKRIPHTSYYLSGLQPEKEYMFRIQAENEFGSSKPTSAVRLHRHSDYMRPVSMPEVSDFDEDFTSAKLRWKPMRGSPLTDRKPGKYTVETWEPVRREWKSVARGVRDTTYRIKDLPKLPDHLFRVRMETDDKLSEPSMPVSISKYSLPKMPVYRPQLYEVDNDTVRLSWQPVHLPEGASRRSVRYIVEQREIPEARWFSIASDVTDTCYKIRGLNPKSDYEFRVKVVIDGTTSEPSCPVSLYRRPVIPKVKFEAPEVYDVDDTSLSLRWNTVDVPAFSSNDEPLLFVLERQTLPGYEWQPIASNLADRSYTVKDLKPYEDYNFRVRGVYPSGYTEPSPYVPVYRRPSESRIGVESSTVDYQSSQKYSYKSPLPLPSTSLHATTAAELKKSLDKTRAYSSPPMRRFSVANIYEAREPLYATEAKFEKVAIPEPKFRKEDAYVYKKARTPSVPLPDFKTPAYEPMKIPEYKSSEPDTKHDLYAWYKTHRRYSVAGLEDSRQSRRSEYLEEQFILGRKKDLIMESQRSRLRRGSVPSIPRPSVVKSDPIPKYPSVADRYEDIKCPYIVQPGHWAFPKRHSISVDWADLQNLQLQLRAQSAKLSSKTRAKSEVMKTPRPSVISQSQDEYFGGTYFKVEDEVKFNDMRPVFARSDLTAPMYRRSLSQERDPGYFVISKFSLAVAGVRKPSTRTSSASRERYVRPASLEPSSYIRRSYTPEPKPWLKTRSLTPDLTDLRAKSYSPDFYEIRERVRQRSDSLAKGLAKSRLSSSSYRPAARPSVDMPRSSMPRSSVPRSPVRQPSPPRRQADYVKPRSYSVSVSREDRKFNRNIAESKSLITNYERLDDRSRRSSIAMVPDTVMVGRTGSFSDIKSDVRYTSTPRGSTSEVKTDRRYSTSHRASVSMTNAEQARLAATVASVKQDSRFSTQRRATIASAVNADLHSKLTSISNTLSSTLSSKPKKKSRPVMKFKSSRGDGVVA